MRRGMLFFIMVVLIAPSCKKNTDDNWYYWGIVTGLKNGSGWSARIRAANNNQPPLDRFNIVLDKLDKNGFVLEGLSFHNIPKAIGTYRLYKKDFIQPPDPQKTTGWYCTVVGGDALCDTYDIIETDSVNNYIQVRGYDPTNNEVTGTFNARLSISRTPKCDPQAPDTITFTHGQFYTKVK